MTLTPLVVCVEIVTVQVSKRIYNENVLDSFLCPSQSVKLCLLFRLDQIPLNESLLHIFRCLKFKLKRSLKPEVETKENISEQCFSTAFEPWNPHKSFPKPCNL